MNDPTIHQNEPRILAENVSFEDFVRDYEGQRVEWHAGKVIEKVSNNKPHQAILAMLTMLIGLYLAYKQRGQLFTDGYPMRLAENDPARQPDLMIVLNEHEKRMKHQYLDGPADLVVEIISPATGRVDRGEKFYEYQNGGVPEYWIIDPESQRVDLYYLDAKGHYQRIAHDPQQIVSRVLPGFELDATLLWREKLPQGAELRELVNTMVQA